LTHTRPLLLLAAAALPAAAGCETADPPLGGNWAVVTIDLLPYDDDPLLLDSVSVERRWVGAGFDPDPPAKDTDDDDDHDNDDNNDDDTADAAPPARRVMVDLARRGSDAEQREPLSVNLSSERAIRLSPQRIQVRESAPAADDAEPDDQEADDAKPEGTGAPEDDGRPTVVVAIDQPAGSFTFTGNPVTGDKNAGPLPLKAGRVRISLHPSLVRAVRSVKPDASLRLALRVALEGLDGARIEQYAGLEAEPTLEDMITLHRAAVTPQTVAAYEQAGYAFDVPALLRLTAAGVTAGDAVELSTGGFRCSADDLIALHEAGVAAADAVAYREAGFADTAEGVLRLHAAGVPTSYAADLRKLMPKLDADGLIAIHGAGVTARDVRVYQQAEYRPDAKTLLILHAAGVRPDDALALREAGYDFAVADLIRLADWDVPASFAEAVMSPRHRRLSSGEIVDLWLRRITPEQVELLRAPPIATTDSVHDPLVPSPRPSTSAVETDDP